MENVSCSYLKRRLLRHAVYDIQYFWDTNVLKKLLVKFSIGFEVAGVPKGPENITAYMAIASWFS